MPHRQCLKCEREANYCLNNGICEYCFLHKPNEYKRKYYNGLCQFDGCCKRASFGQINTKEILWCNTHKQVGCVNNKRTAYNRLTCNCGQKAVYGPKLGKAERCKEHKLETDIYTTNRNKICRFENCIKRASFGIDANDKYMYCLEHKSGDCKSNKKCQECDVGGSYRVGNKYWCVKHKPDESKIGKKICEYSDCKTVASFGTDKPIHCKKHKLSDEYDLVHKKCNANIPPYSSYCEKQIANNSYDGFCTRCFSYLFPKDSRCSNIRVRTKELKVRDYLNINHPGFIHDKPLYVDFSGGCCPTSRRIDFRKMIGNTMLAIEVDENQHKRSYYNDKETRYSELINDLTCKYIFIRFNPDKFIVNGKVCNPKMDYRLSRLTDLISRLEYKILNEESDDMLKECYLFYDIDTTNIILE